MTTKELYDTLIRKPNLHSLPELHDQLLVWPLYKNAFIQAYCDHSITCIDIISNSLFSSSLMHWHPDESEMLDELYTLGKKGNILVLNRTLFATSVLYTGPAEACPLSHEQGLHFGKKKWDSGRLIRLEQK